MTPTYRATFALPGTEESIQLNHEWNGAWYVAEHVPHRKPAIVSKAFKTEAQALAVAEAKKHL